MNSIKLPKQLQLLTEQFVFQWQVNNRFRWMIRSVGYIALFYCALTLNDFRREHSENLSLLQHKSVRLTQLKNQTDWPERLAAEAAVSEKIIGKLWSASSPSLAEADLQNLLRDLLASHHAQNVRLRLSPSEPLSIGGRDMLKVTAEASGNLAVADINHLFKSIADQPKHLYIDRLSFSAQGSGQISLYVTAYFTLVQTVSPSESMNVN